jgi:hypothetical protein
MSPLSMALAKRLWVKYPEKISGKRVTTSIRREACIEPGGSGQGFGIGGEFGKDRKRVNFEPQTKKAA